MEHVIRGAIVYLFLLVLFRISGKRTLAEVTTFDVILLLIISEAAQQALLGQDYSFTAAAIVISTLVGMDVLLAWISTRSEKVQKLLDSVPLVILEDGKPIRDRMEKSGVDETEILHAARELQGIASLDQIKYAVLERSGGITVIPNSENERSRK
jgi:uncharacterized membrane protein YcaP (DUF421 family)